MHLPSKSALSLYLVHRGALLNYANGIIGDRAQAEDVVQEAYLRFADAAARWGGDIDGQFGLFEVDEFWMDTVVPALGPRCVLLGNLFRDQLDRYGELETIADRWAAMVSGLPAGTALALNADDPLIADLGRGRGAVSYFGIEDR